MKPPRTESHIPTSRWPTANGQDIPRSESFKPGHKLHEFVSFVRDNATLEPETKALVYGLVDTFKEAKGKSR